ncbi:MAG TPA: M20/M25/M40 family metallo-hydrolase [Phycisphaerae bacterium]|nr:M20/M25/M40 family metallo-hydrolase [Phycisphaerae bacterium]
MNNISGAHVATIPLNSEDQQTSRATELVSTHALEFRELLCESIRFPSVSGSEGPFVHFIATWARRMGFEVDLWQATEDSLQCYPQSKARHLALAGRPTAVIRLRGTSGGPSIGFNAHSDVVAAPEPERWSDHPWTGVTRENRIFGRGACDTKGPLVSALLALYAIRESRIPHRGDIFVELIPGEEDCVGLGTLTSHVRGHVPDALIVLEPTESMPRYASRGGLRFEISCIGRSVHSTVKWAGVDAIDILRAVLDCLKEMETDSGKVDVHPLFAGYPIARPITVDAVRGGQWQGMVCDSSQCTGYLELLPDDDLSAYQARFSDELHRRLAARNRNPEHILINFVETYTGHEIPLSNPLCHYARRAVDATLAASNSPREMSGFNSGCEAGLRASLLGTPTIVWGPGSLMQAHCVDEYVCWSDVQAVAEMFVRTALAWTRGNHS